MTLFAFRVFARNLWKLQWYCCGVCVESLAQNVWAPLRPRGMQTIAVHLAQRGPLIAHWDFQLSACARPFEQCHSHHSSLPARLGYTICYHPDSLIQIQDARFIIKSCMWNQSPTSLITRTRSPYTIVLALVRIYLILTNAA